MKPRIRLPRLSLSSPCRCQFWSSRQFSSSARPDSTATSPPTSAEGEKEQKKEGKVIFSGIQPTGTPHLGNYLGALRGWKKLQDEAGPETTLLFSIVDLHALTSTNREHRGLELRKRSREMLAVLLAIGLDPKRCTIFVQSQVWQHAELMWVLSCTASMGYLGRMTQWKSKLNLSDSASPLSDTTSKSKLKLGLFSYPVLQAADILVHGATHVPVGEDQSQHLEFARECVTNFNATYGDVLVKPKTILSPTAKIHSLTSPTQKMSKSHPSALSRILLTDPPSLIQQKIKGAVTDSTNTISYDPVKRPGVSNLLDILAAFDVEGRTPQDLINQQGMSNPGWNLGRLKNTVTETLSEGMLDIRREYKRLIADEAYLDEVERKGAQRARESAEGVMCKVREVVGIGGGEIGAGEWCGGRSRRFV